MNLIGNLFVIAVLAVLFSLFGWGVYSHPLFAVRFAVIFVPLAVLAWATQK